MDIVTDITLTISNSLVTYPGDPGIEITRCPHHRERLKIESHQIGYGGAYGNSR